MREIELTIAENGFIVTEYDGESESYPRKQKKAVFEHTEQEGGDVIALQNMLWYIVDQLGLSGGRYDKNRIHIEIRPGDKYQEPKDE